MDIDLDDLTGPDFSGTLNVDPNDEMGLGLLTNSNYNAGKSSGGGMGGGVSFDIGSGPSIPEINIMGDNIGTIDMDLNALPSAPQISVARETSYYNSPQNAGFSTVQLSSTPGLSAEDERRQKNEYITKLQRLEKKGYPITKQFTTDMPLAEMKEEYERLIDAKKLEGSIQWQRDAVVFAIQSLEMLNDQFPFLGLKLKGWKDSVQDKIENEQFDDIFEELYEKYKGKSYMPPEVRLLFGIASSGFLCHYSNKMMDSLSASSMNAGVEAALRSNPELAAQVAAASMQQTMPAMGSFMGATGGFTNAASGGFTNAAPPSMRAGGPAPAFTATQANPMNGGTGPFFGTGRAAEMPQNIAAQSQAQTARKEMRGPAGVDDILKTFESVRRAESSGETYRPPSPQLPQQQIPMSAAMAAAMDMQSVGSDDIRSVMTDQTTGGTRRKRRAPPVGASMSLNV
jgi:hypothetical protein